MTKRDQDVIADLIGRPMRAKFATGDEKGIYEIVGHLDEPSFTMKKQNGETFSWACSLVGRLAPSEEAEYWRDRALMAEKKLNPK